MSEAYSDMSANSFRLKLGLQGSNDCRTLSNALVCCCIRARKTSFLLKWLVFQSRVEPRPCGCFHKTIWSEAIRAERHLNTVNRNRGPQPGCWCLFCGSWVEIPLHLFGWKLGAPLSSESLLWGRNYIDLNLLAVQLEPNKSPPWRTA